MQTLRPYQEAGLHRVAEARRGGARRVILVLPTGGGKTTMFAELIKREGSRALVIVHRMELLAQAVTRLREHGIVPGIIHPDHPRNPLAKVQVGMIQTMHRRGVFPAADVVICDEAHLSAAASWSKALAQYPDAFILGVTATPWRLGGRPLLGEFDTVVVAATPTELRTGGYLCDFVGFSYRTPDLSGVAVQGGEYNAGQASAAMRATPIVDDIVEKWQAHASKLSTIVFAAGVDHSRDLVTRFRAAGVRAEHIDGQSVPELRRGVLDRVRSGETRVLCNVGVAIEGLDIPRLKCCVLARPTKSLTLAIQMMGRVRRPWHGEVARIHDHAFNVREHGLPDDNRDYSLQAKRDDPPSLATCETCLAIYAPGSGCPFCLADNESDVATRGERAVLAEAEMFTFDATTTRDTLETPRVPVPISWSQCREGRTIEGTYSGSVTEPGDWGPRKRHLVASAKRTYSVEGTARLDALVAAVKVGDLIRITYRGRAAGGKAHAFSLELDVASVD